MTRTDLTRRGLGRDLAVSIILVLFSLLFCAIYAVFLLSFRGEFLIVVRGMWILPVFLVLLVGSAAGSLWLAVKGLSAGRPAGVIAEGLGGRARDITWIVGWSVWNLAAIVPILLVGKVMALGALGSVPIFLIGVLAFPFAGYAVLFAADSMTRIVGVLRSRTPHMMRATAAAGFAFLFACASFGIVAVAWHPRWSAGMTHTTLFLRGEEPGRGYRIPSMTVLPGDVVLAFAESRVDAMSDLLDINIVMKRSTDAGGNWGPLATVLDVGRHTVHSPTVVYDKATGTVWLGYCIDYSSLYVISSPDQGRTWSAPRDLSQELGVPADTWCHSGPGSGIQLTSGRLVIPATLGEPRAVYSDNHGRTWKLGKPIGSGEEPQMFERADGTVSANLRAGLGKNRIVATSSDGGESWAPWQYAAGLPDSDTQGSILRVSPRQIAFANPGAGYRAAMTLRLSSDEGATWPVSRLVYEGAAGYSQLGVVSDGTILLLFETGRFDLRESITLVRVGRRWPTGE
jgi:sialidase-1